MSQFIRKHGLKINLILACGTAVCSGLANLNNELAWLPRPISRPLLNYFLLQLVILALPPFILRNTKIGTSVSFVLLSLLFFLNLHEAHEIIANPPLSYEDVGLKGGGQLFLFILGLVPLALSFGWWFIARAAGFTKAVIAKRSNNSLHRTGVRSSSAGEFKR